MKTAFLHGRSFRPNGACDSLFTREVELIEKPLPHHIAGLSYTASGYGRRIPSRYMVKFEGKWRRVYICQFSNCGTAYIGPWAIVRGAELTVSGV